MKALVMYGPNEFGVKEVPTPFCSPNEVLIKVATVAICGSDPGLLSGKNLADGLPASLPHIPGHEGAGTIVECGEMVRGFRVGDRVAIESHLGCGYCDNCQAGRYNLCINFGNLDAGHKQYGFTVPGCFAEYCVCRPEALHRIPENLTFDHGALTDTLSTAFHIIQQAGIVPGGWALVVGCGPVGIAMLMLCRAMGSRVIALETGSRLTRAKELGAEVTIDFVESNPLEEILAVTDGIGADRCFDCAGNKTSMNLALAACRRGGTVGLVAIPANKLMEIDVKTIVWDEKKLVGSRGNPNCHRQIMEMMSAGFIKAEEMITHHFPLERFNEAINLFTSRQDGVIKVIITI
jgi:L-iditol 2-dehydrogenase